MSDDAGRGGDDDTTRKREPDDVPVPATDRPRRPARESDDDGPPSRPDSEAGADERRAPGAANLVAVAASTVGFEAAIWVVLRYVPEYLRSLGVGAPLIGAFGTLWLLGRWLGDGRLRSGSRRVVLGATAAALGLAVWTVAPALAGDSATLAWSLVVAGAAGVAGWTLLGPASEHGRWPLGAATDAVAPARPGWTLAALTATVAVLALARSFPAGFRVVLALAAALGVTVATLWTVGDLDPPDSGRTAADPAEPEPRRPPDAGAVLSRTGLALASTFLVVVVTDVLALEAVVFGRRLAPATVFGLCLAAELAAATLATALGPRLVDAAGERVVAVYGSVVAATFPLVLVSAPSNPLVVVAVFAAFGTRTVGTRIVGSVGRRGVPLPAAETPGETDPSERRGRRVDVAGMGRADLRELAVAAAPFVGGLLYAASPVLAFGGATAVGAVGAWERIRRTESG